jgi:protease I
MKVLIVSADGFEDSELWVPLAHLRKAGFEVDVASFARGTIRGKHGRDAQANLAIMEVDPRGYAALILPGGTAPAALRREPAVLRLAREFFEAGTPVAAICHGPQILVSAGLLKGRAATCYKSMADEIIGAGARYLDRPVVVDGNLITSRRPADLPAFLRETLKQLRTVREAATSPLT